MKIAVGLSGGVDSAVSALLLKQQGHEVIGVFMKNWSDDFGLQGDCPWEEDQKDAKAVAEHLGINFLTYNFELQYRERVIKYFFDEYKNGRTPNPDILCNSEIKFDVFLKKCLFDLNVDKVATGHYARVVENQGQISLLKGIDGSKDQSYFLCRLTQEELKRVIFPIGNLEKSKVREIAKVNGLPVAEKKDSQGICFVGEIDFKKFVEKELGSEPGNIVNINSKEILGRHNGLWFYTIGQREGLGLGGGPWFVVEKDLKSNEIRVCHQKDQLPLLKSEVILTDLNFLNPELLMQNSSLEAMLRYRQKTEKVSIEFINDNKNIKLIFSTPQRAVAPGQFGCIFYKDELIGSGVIL